MSATVNFVWMARLGAMGVALLFSLITLALSGNITQMTDRYYFYYQFAALGIAVSVLTLLTLPVLIVVDFLRRGAFTSLVAVELGWIGILWVLWLATGALTASAGFFTQGCNILFSTSLYRSNCHKYQAMEAFSFLTWLVLLGYWVLLLASSIIATTRGNSMIWTCTVKDSDFFAADTSAVGAPGEVKSGNQFQGQQYPPQQYAPQQYPVQGVPEQPAQAYSPQGDLQPAQVYPPQGVPQQPAQGYPGVAQPA